MSPIRTIRSILPYIDIYKKNLNFTAKFITVMAEKYARPQIFLIPWDPESAEHRDRLYQQRVTCGWKQDRIDKWCKYQREGCMSIHWVVSIYYHVI